MKSILKGIFKVGLLLAFCAAAVVVLSGCNTATTVTEYDANGKIVKVTENSSESPLKNKSMAGGGGFSAIKVESTGSASSGTPTANITLGGGAAGFASSPKEDERPVFSYSWSCGLLQSMTSMSAGSGNISYIGVKNETAAETAKRLSAALAAKTGFRFKQ